METQGQQDAQLIGVLVDAVNTVLELEAEEIEPSPKFGAAVHSDFILGMAKLDKVGFVQFAGSRTCFLIRGNGCAGASGKAASD